MANSITPNAGATNAAAHWRQDHLVAYADPQQQQRLGGKPIAK